MENYVITIARGFGSGGKDIGTRLAKELGIPCYDRELLAMASEKSGIDENLFVEVDEKLRVNYLTKLLTKVAYCPTVEPHEKAFISDNNLFQIQSEIIKELSKTQSCVIIGKCADYVLRNCKNVVSVYIEAPRPYCVQSIMEKLYVNEKRANQLITKTDKYRADYYKYYTEGNYWTNPVNYDITLNSAKIGRQKCVEIIKSVINIKFGE